MSEDCCALNADGSLKDASDITFFNDPDDEVPLPQVPPSAQPSSSTTSTKDAFSILLKAGHPSNSHSWFSALWPAHGHMSAAVEAEGHAAGANVRRASMMLTECSMIGLQEVTMDGSQWGLLKQGQSQTSPHHFTCSSAAETLPQNTDFSESLPIPNGWIVHQ
ncbi:uncharacterized protein F5891DRAFT_1187799 [Suillus fuscotomentosus]|uniref:Uncharacterized protein n=1 Tax=Suillus fuscotomentosus TaxID=1912939 RepID=A0AAD4E9V4_9AGAM|nr:uncharacterized protein F5891DRAFT_1187799 [Suillus fuscotomentosus]KAG1901099.1 hypothetical protein F5891DRAFT_1187799 [Suillus fuscotomentosus]